MNERRLREALRRTPPPDASNARERARAVMRAGFDGRPRSAPRPRRIALPVAAALAAALVALAIALTPPGDAVADWVRDLVRGTSDAPRPQPALARLPGDGRLLVSGAGGAWIVHPDGSRRRLGGYGEATWSPQGIYVGATRGHDLVAVDPRGAVRWVLTRPSPVHDPRWAPSGVLVAYRSGESLRVVEGDGDGDRLIARRVPAIAAAWRPGPRPLLSYVDRSGRIVVRDIAARRRLRSLRPGIPVQRLEWSSDGSRLLVSGPRGVRVLDGAGRVAARLDAPAGTAFVHAALSPRGGRMAIVARRRADGRHDVLIASAATPRPHPRSAFRAKGQIRSITWSPARQIVLADWTGSDQWLFLSAGRGGAASAVSGISAHFDPGSTRPRGDVRVQGWCCP